MIPVSGSIVNLSRSPGDETKVYDILPPFSIGSLSMAFTWKTKVPTGSSSFTEG